MFGSGKYVRDPTAGIADIKDLPPPEIVLHSYNYQREPCLHWGHRAYRHQQGQRMLHDLGDLCSGRATMSTDWARFMCPITPALKRKRAHEGYLFKPGLLL
jgi:hypothetical protein